VTNERAGRVSKMAGDALRRLPFASGDADDIVALCKAHGGHNYAALLLDLTSDARGVFLIGGDEGPMLAMTVVDRVRNGGDAAILETLAVRAPIDAASFTRLVIEPALAFVRAGERRALHVPLPPATAPAEGAEGALRAAGFTRLYGYFEMRRPRSAPAPAAPEPLPAGWSWAALDGGRVDDAHAALTAMFRDALGTSVIPLADFRRAVVSGAASWRMLLDGERIAGLLRTALHGARGEIGILGRAPAYRGRGLGARLVAEGLRVLRVGGAADIDIGVETANERALELYLAFGFEILTRTPVFGLTLR